VSALAIKLSPLAVALCAALLGGCGLGAGPAPSAVKLTVSSEFGAHVLHHSGPLKLRGQETVMSLLGRNYPIVTRYGGGFVQSIDGLAGGQEANRPVDWFYYDNGIQADKGAAATNVDAGDHIWWDRHDWSQTADVPAVVGSFPEPFRNGIGGKRYPVRVECAQISGAACTTVRRQLRAVGVPAAAAGLGAGSEPKTLRLIVGAWSQIGFALGAQSIERGPRASGVYARFSPDGRTLTPLDQDGRRLRPLSSGTGLIAATRQGEDAPIWVVTGTDAAGVELAARSFNERALRDRFAVVETPAGNVALPEPTP
jgi:hypothetical protein